MSDYVRPTRVVVSLKALKNNWSNLRGRLPKTTGILAVVKANAYGHGIIEMTRACTRLGAVGVAVADVSEALILRKASYRGLILCLGATNKPALLEALRKNVVVTLYHEDGLKEFDSILKKSRRPLRVHLKIETGMNRLGLLDHSWKRIAARLNQLQKICVEGIFTHFANADDADRSFTKEQTHKFNEAVDIFERSLGKRLIRHASNTASILNFTEASFDWVRPGIGLYGFPPLPLPSEAKPFIPILEWRAPILQVKTVAQGQTVGYNRDFTAPKAMTVATVACGYGDGFRRTLAPVGVGFRGKRTPIVGIICMDLLMIDVAEQTDVRVGEEVTLLGAPSSGAADAREMAQSQKTIPYEILTGINARVSRVWSKD